MNNDEEPEPKKVTVMTIPATYEHDWKFACFHYFQPGKLISIIVDNLLMMLMLFLGPTLTTVNVVHHLRGKLHCHDGILKYVDGHDEYDLIESQLLEAGKQYEFVDFHPQSSVAPPPLPSPPTLSSTPHHHPALTGPRSEPFGGR